MLHFFEVCDPVVAQVKFHQICEILQTLQTLDLVVLYRQLREVHQRFEIFKLREPIPTEVEFLQEGKRGQPLQFADAILLQEEFREEERKRMELAEMELKKPYADLSRIGKVKLLWNSLVPEAAEDPDR